MFADHGPDGSGEPLTFLLRPGNAGSNTASDHIEATRLKLRLRIFSAAGRIARGSRRLRLRLAARWPWAEQITAGINRLQNLAPG